MKLRIGLLFILTILACEESFDIPSGVPSIVRIEGGFAFTTNGELGVDVIDLSTRETINKIFPAKPSQSIDNISIADGFLFALDARGEGYLSVFSISDLRNIKLVSKPIRVQGGPFTGVSARKGNVVASGGTTFMNFRKYNEQGELSTGEGRFGRDRGHPDILLNDEGDIAVVSTDFNSPVNGERFGIITVKLDEIHNSPLFISELGIQGAGFTDGTTRPAGFPIQTVFSKGHILVATGSGLTIVSANAGQLGLPLQFDIDLMATDIAIYEDVAYIVGSQPAPTLVKVDVVDLNNPVLIERVALDIGNSIPTSVAVNDEYIIVAANEAGLIILDR